MIARGFELVYVRYEDHVLFNRCSALTMKPQVREAIGWLVYDSKYYVTISWDRDAEPPTLKGGDAKASGLVLLKADVLELKKIHVDLAPLQISSECHLNLEPPTLNNEYAFRPTERKTQRKSKGEKTT
jgi:hypothetical protein